jgi:hypothetical protein
MYKKEEIHNFQYLKMNIKFIYSFNPKIIKGKKSPLQGRYVRHGPPSFFLSL